MNRCWITGYQDLQMPNHKLKMLQADELDSQELKEFYPILADQNRSIILQAINIA